MNRTGRRDRIASSRVEPLRMQAFGSCVATLAIACAGVAQAGTAGFTVTHHRRFRASPTLRFEALPKKCMAQLPRAQCRASGALRLPETKEGPHFCGPSNAGSRGQARTDDPLINSQVL